VIRVGRVGGMEDLRKAVVIIIIIFCSEPSMHMPVLLLFDFW